MNNSYREYIGEVPAFNLHMEPSCPNNHCPVFLPSPLDEYGHLISNNAKLSYKADFIFEYDGGKNITKSVSLGDKVKCVFYSELTKIRDINAKSTPTILSIIGIVREIRNIGRDGSFSIVIDSSEEFSSKKYEINSRLILYIDTTDHIDPIPSNPVVCSCNEIIGGDIPSMSTNEHLKWNDNFLLIKDKERDYHVLEIFYTKPTSEDVLLCITDMTGKVVYKALDTSKKSNNEASFIWTLRDYTDYIDSHFTLKEKLANFDLDSYGNFVMTDRAKGNADINTLEQSNDTIVNAVKVRLELVMGDNLEDYNPMNPANYKNYKCIISKPFTIDKSVLDLVTKNTIIESSTIEE